MSRNLTMVCVNKLDTRTLRTFSITHSWDGHNEVLNGINLAPKSTSHPVQITSGYFNYDWYTVQVEIDGLGVRQTNFYCNSSSGENKIVMEIYKDYVDCRYYINDKEAKNPCLNKSWSGQFEDEINQTDIRKVEPK